MPPRDPHAVLGVEPGAAPEVIKSAWRALARRHHPDLTTDDPAAIRRETRRMAEINAAYATLTRAGETPEGRRKHRAEAADDPAAKGPSRPAATAADPGHAGPPPPLERHVTGRLDTSASFITRDQVTTPRGSRSTLGGQPPLARDRSRPELRASRPSGPMERDRSRDHVLADPPTLDEALAQELEFGKFHGHTLGEVAAFEPSYIDWLAGTFNRDPVVSVAARVIQAELDRLGVHREHRPQRPGWQSNPFR